MAANDAAAVHGEACRLPVFCPNPAMPLWSSHPRVFLDVADTGSAMCPYCGTQYRLEGGPRKPGTDARNDGAASRPEATMARERILIVAPSWVGDAILSEPLIALLRQPYEHPRIDVLAPPWCGPVYARMRGIRRVIESPFGHGKVDLAGRRRLAGELRKEAYARAIVLPNSWKSALIPFLARIPLRTGYVGEARWALLNDPRRLVKGACRGSSTATRRCRASRAA